MTENPIAIASDHGGFDLKSRLLEVLRAKGREVVDLGTSSSQSVDYPDYAVQVARGVAEGRFRAGVLICGSGIGMSIVANRIPGVRAALCTSAYMARVARAHNDANVLCLGQRVIGAGEAEDILEAFLAATFEGGRHARRVGKIEPVTGAGNP
jgi:ribose 5-phosphate isomerase B